MKRQPLLYVYPLQLGKKHILNGVKNGVFTTNSDSSVWVDLTECNLDKKILLRSTKKC